MSDTGTASALHAPPASYGEAAPPLKGILKNAHRRSSSAGSALRSPDDVLAATEPAAEPTEPRPANVAEGAVPYRDSEGRLHWDESNLASNDFWKENSAPRMKIDEPKTPFVQGASAADSMDIPPVDDDFALDKPPQSEAGNGSPPPHAISPAADAELTRLNTEANARLGQGRESVEHERERERERGSRSSQAGSDAGRSSRSSRSPSFSLPNGQLAVAGRRRSSAGSSAAAGPDTAALRAANGGGSSSALSSEYEDESSSEEDAPPMSVDEQRKHAAFAAKRKGHYGHEADALKYARELMAQEEEEEEEEQGGGLPPSVPPVPPVPRAFQ